MSVARCKAETTSTEFVKWKVKRLDMIQNSFHREDHLAALIAAEIAKTRVKDPKKIQPKDFLPTFVLKDGKEIKPLDKATSVAWSKAAWTQRIPGAVIRKPK